MQRQPRIEVLLATYNSARFLRPMLESLIAQSEPDFHLVISDDCSTDDTLAIVESMKGAFANPPEIRRRAVPSGSAMANFSQMLTESRGRYVLLADHDDIWLPGRIADAVARLEILEAESGAATPILTHCDLSVIDAEGNSTGSTLWRLKAADPRYGQRLNTALVNATVAGCAAAMNRALIDRAGSVPREAIMHDWWLNLVAVTFGRVDIDPDPKVLYRIHGANASHPRRVSAVSMAARASIIGTVREKMARRIKQAWAFQLRFAGALPAREQAVLDDFVALGETGYLNRRLICANRGFRYPDLWRTAALWALA